MQSLHKIEIEKEAKKIEEEFNVRFELACENQHEDSENEYDAVFFVKGKCLATYSSKSLRDIHAWVKNKAAPIINLTQGMSWHDKENFLLMSDIKINEAIKSEVEKRRAKRQKEAESVRNFWLKEKQ